MATKVPVSVEQYLRMNFDGADCELVDGELVERNAGEKPWLKKLYVFSEQDLMEVPAFEITDPAIRITPAEIL